MDAPHTPKRDFYLTSSFIVLTPPEGEIDDDGHWKKSFANPEMRKMLWAQRIIEAEKSKAVKANLPLPPLPEEDFEFYLNMGTNGFHFNQWNVDADTLEKLHDHGFMSFNYARNFYFFAPKKPDGSVDILGCVDVIRKRFLNRKAPFLLCAGLESLCNFAGAYYPFKEERPKDRKHAYELYFKFFLNHCVMLKEYYEYCRIHNIGISELQVMFGHNQQWHHYCAEWGAQTLFSEGNADLCNDQLRTCMIRGAARQYNRKWFLYWSSWGGVDKHLTSFDENGHLHTGISTSLSLRQWIGSFYSGCDYCGGTECPQTQMMYYDKKGKRQISEFGRNLKKFSDFVFKRHPKRGTPYVPVAVMLDYYHGWCVMDHRVWGGALPYTRNEEMIQNFFDAAFPGNRQYIDSCSFLPARNEESILPWRSQEEMWELERNGKIDHKLYEKGNRTDSTWGDSFDTLLTNCPLEVLKTYPALLLLGRIDLDDELRGKLRQYVESGGILIANSIHVSPEDAEFLGVEFTGKRDLLWEVKCHECGGVCRDMTTEFDLVKPGNADVMMKSIGGWRFGYPDAKRVPGYDGADPVITVNKIGKGKVIFCTVPYMQTEPGSAMHPAFQDLITHVMEEVMPIELKGPSIEYMVNRTETGWIVTLLHNGPDYWKGKSPETWQGEIIFKKEFLSGNPERLTELWSDTELMAEKTGKGLKLKMEVSAFEFKIVELSE